MTYDTSNVVASVAKTLEPDRSQSASHRVAGMTQDQLAAQALVEAERRKVETTDKTDKSKFKHEDGDDGKGRHHHQGHQRPPTPDGQDHLIDTVA